MNATYWRGVSEATDADHDECYRRYGSAGELASYHFEVADDLSAVRIIPATDGANGIWTLAEIKASGAAWPKVAAVAALMRGAVKAE